LPSVDKAGNTSHWSFPALVDDSGLFKLGPTEMGYFLPATEIVKVPNAIERTLGSLANRVADLKP
jgi:hypothetical protein